jgi:chlorophyll/bacteriochlorophyll a synthase
MTLVIRSLHNQTLSLPRPGAVLELFKPVTWFPPMWAFGCGVVSAGVPLTSRWTRIALGVAVAGPLVCAASQAVNDWFDRHVDAINQPERPIPSGRLPGRWGLGLAIAWSLLSLAVAVPLGGAGAVATLVALLLAWAYSAPPLRLKENGWVGNAAVGFSYEGLAWVTGASVALAPTLPSAAILTLAFAYSIGAHGIMTLNDFKSIEGDRRMGVRSLPASLGPRPAARLACLTMLLPQLAVLVLLYRWGHVGHALGVALLVAAQLPLMRRFLAQPIERATWFSGLGVTLYVVGMMVSAFGLRAGGVAG